MKKIWVVIFSLGWGMIMATTSRLEKSQESEIEEERLVEQGDSAAKKLIKLRNGTKVEEEKVSRVFKSLQQLIRTYQKDTISHPKVVWIDGFTVLGNLVDNLRNPQHGPSYLVPHGKFELWIAVMKDLGLCDEEGRIDEETRNIIISSYQKGSNPALVNPQQPLSWWQKFKKTFTDS